MDHRRTLGWKGLAIIVMCIFCIYKMDQIALDTDSSQSLSAPKPALSMLDIHSLVEKHYDDAVSNIKDVTFENSEGPRTWITMGLCWSANAQVHGKENFPYKDAAPLSAQLWMKLTPTKVILQIVYSEEEISDELKEYKKELESYGAVVFLVPTGSDMKCVLKSQMIRLLAYALPFIRDEDIIVTADVDAFVMTKDIYKPLLLPGRQIWIYRYAFTMGTGATFMMPFIGIKASVWKNILQYDLSMDQPDKGLLGNGLPKMIEDYGTKMSFSESYTWDIDQHILSHAILSSGICSLPGDNKLWKELNIEPREFDDGKTCWHGSGIYEDCNNVLWTRNLYIRYKGNNCKWWHFYPSETYAELRSKFQEIINGKAENQIVHDLIKEAKDFQIENLGREIF